MFWKVELRVFRAGSGLDDVREADGESSAAVGILPADRC
jgi:hypothetical protein